MTDVDDYDDWDDREPEPTEDQIMRYERERYLRSLSPLGRAVEPIRALIWRHTWRWRVKPNATEPPF